MRNVLLAAILAAAACTVMAGAQTTTQPAPATQPTQRWAETIRKLGSEQFSDRQAGQNELAKATWRDRDLLDHLAEATTDPEVQERLRHQLAVLDAAAEVDPPPISLDLDHASVADTVAALAKATRLPFTIADSVAGKSTFTLHASEQSFPDLYLSLCTQETLRPFDNSGLQLSAGDGVHTGASSGPCLVYPLRLVSQNEADYQGADGSGHRMDLTYVLVIDPRLAVVARDRAVFRSVTDQAGIDHPLPLPAQTDWQGTNGNWYLVLQQSLPWLEGSKVATFHGDVHLQVATENRQVVVDDLEKQGNAPIALGDMSLTFRSVRRTDAGLSFMVSLGRAGAGPRPPANTLPPSAAIALYTTDDKMIWKSRVTAGANAVVLGSFPGAIKAVITLPTATKEVHLPIELKDLPVP